MELDNDGQQQQGEEEMRRATECHGCRQRPVGSHFVYEYRAGFYHEAYRCDECYALAVDYATQAAIKAEITESKAQRDADSGWLYGAGDRPSERFAPKDNEEKR